MSRHSRVWLAAFTIAAISSVAFAAKAPIDIPGSRWATSGTAKFSLQKAGSISGLLYVDLTFGPTMSPSLGSNQVEMILDDGIIAIPVSGSYSETKPGAGTPTVNVNGQEFADAVLELALAELGPLPPDVDVALIIDQFTLKAKAKSKNGVENMSVKFKSKGRLEVEGPAGSETLKLSFSYSGAGPRF